MFLLGRPRFVGRENLRGVTGPVIVVANHVTYIDPAFVVAALPAHHAIGDWPSPWTANTSNPCEHLPLALDFFAGAFSRVKYFLIVSLFNVFPLPLLAGFRKSFEFAGDLADRGWSVLIFPEGAITRDGRNRPVSRGNWPARNAAAPACGPVRLDGLFELKQAGKRWARPGQITSLNWRAGSFQRNGSAEQIAQELERRVAALGGESA